MRRLLVLVIATITSIAIAQTQGHDDGSEEGDPTGGASASASIAVPLPRTAASSRVIVAKEGMVFVAGGRFTMGSGEVKAAPNERPIRAATATAFWIDRTEVTVAAYRACVDARKCDPPERSSALCTYDMGQDSLPVSCVHWQDADVYCRSQNKRLPTETEWELAARGGGANRYPWGSTASSCLVAATLLHDATGRSCTGRRPAHVGAYPMNVSPFGAVDMAGNVEEWTSDWYVERPASGARVTSGSSHVLRGGGWLSRPIDARTTSRNWGSSMEAGPNVGFRCARD